MSKLLFIQYRRAAKVMGGGEQCTKRNYDMLCKAVGAANVEVYIIHEEENHSALKEYIKGALYMPFGYFFGLTPKRVRELVEKAKSFDYVFIDRSVFGILAKALKEGGYKGKIITHFHNVEKQYFDDKVSKRLPFRNILIRCADKNDAWACRYSDELVALNKRDAECLQKLYNIQVHAVIPISLADKAAEVKERKALTSPKLKCLFLGSYFTPNNEGIIWFMRHVAPQVEVEIKIVGKGMAQLKADEPEILKEVEVISDAPELLPYISWADVMVLPIFSGSGMKVKTCESLMNGKNIIGTDEAFEGYEIEEGVSGWRCNTAEEYIACIQDFEEHARPHWNAAARKLYLEKYSEQAVIDKFKSILER